jgi:hypothetical protein
MKKKMKKNEGGPAARPEPLFLTPRLKSAI